jgi:hypothetical protein
VVVGVVLATGVEEVEDLVVEVVVAITVFEEEDVDKDDDDCD